MTDDQILAIAEECAVLRRLCSESYVLMAVSRIEAIVDPHVDEIKQAERRSQVQRMLGERAA